VPMPIMERYRVITLSADIMMINKIRFFMSISRNVRFGTSEMIENMRETTLLSCFKNILGVYRQRGFRVRHALMDGQFEPLRGDLAAMGVELNTASNDEHVPEIERYNRTVKERVRGIYNTLPFKRMPGRMVIEMVSSSVFWLNAFPANGGVSPTLSPRTLITGSTIDFNKHCKLEFGEYAQVHEEHDNSMVSRTTGAIALRPTGNAQGGYFFLSLTSGRRLNRNNWTKLPMPQDVIDRVHVLGRRYPRGLTFGDRNGDAVLDDYDNVNDDDDDESYDPDDDASASTDDDSSDVGTDDSDDDDDDVDDDSDDDDDDDEDNDDTHPRAATGVPPPAPDGADADDDDAASASIAGVDDDETEPAADDNTDDIAAEMDNKYGPRTGAYSLCPQKAPNYEHLHLINADLQHPMNHISLTQYNVKKGLKLFGQDGVDAVLKEVQQLHDRDVLLPKDPQMLTPQEKSSALTYLMFLKKKRCGKIKGRGCADGRKQRAYVTKEDSSSPTVSLEALMLSLIIDAKEGRDVATVDIPGAFMQTDMEEKVYMRIDGVMADLLVKIDPDKYKKFVTKVRGKSVLYVLLNKALYGTIMASLLFWKDLCKTLEEWGFEANPYDLCVMNKTINGKQFTIAWHVDDLKLSHVDPNVVTSVIEDMSERYGKDVPLTVTRGKVHDYLGMVIDFTEEGRVKITMYQYIDEMLAGLPEDMDGEAPSPAPAFLFEVNPKAMPLEQNDKDMFHHNVAKLLFLCKRAHPDLQTAVAFLMTHVKPSDADDYKKLRRVMCYLRATKRLPLVLVDDGTGMLRWYADSSFAVHCDMRSHTGGFLTLGKGAAYSTSTRQKLNTKSSTEAELVGVDDIMPQVIWTRYFLEAQGYKVNDNIVHQDNEHHGRRSSGR